MRDELSARQAAVRLRLAGEKVEEICQTVNRSVPWFHKWWRRYMELGAIGL
jgi:transposase-like protein